MSLDWNAGGLSCHKIRKPVETRISVLSASYIGCPSRLVNSLCGFVEAMCCFLKMALTSNKRRTCDLLASSDKSTGAGSGTSGPLIKASNLRMPGHGDDHNVEAIAAGGDEQGERSQRR
jgi:hypothetical protein